MQGGSRNNIDKMLTAAQVGPGGKDCLCCFDAPKHRKQIYRINKKKEKRLAMKDIYIIDNYEQEP